MPLISLSVKHNRSLDDARGRLDDVVAMMLGRFGSMVQRVEWSAQRDEVKLFGPGMELHLRVDAQDVHVTGDMPLVEKLLAGPLVTGIKGMLRQAFTKRLT